MDKDGKALANETFDFDFDSAPILNGERRTETGKSFRFIGGIGPQSHILRSPDRVEYPVRYETDIGATVVWTDCDYEFTPRPDADDVLDFRVLGGTKVMHTGTLKRAAAPWEATSPVCLIDPSPWVGTWLGTVTKNDKSTFDEYFEFTPQAVPLFGYRESGNIRQTVPVEKMGQKFGYKVGTDDYSVQITALKAGADRVAYTFNKVGRIGRFQPETLTVGRTLTLKKDEVGYEYRTSAPGRPAESGAGTLKRLPPFGGFWAGDMVGRVTEKGSIRVLDGGRPIHYVSHGPADNVHQCEFTHVGQRIVTTEPDGRQFVFTVRHLDTTPFRSAYVVERWTGPTDPAAAGGRDFLLSDCQRTGNRVQSFSRVSADGTFNNDMPYRLGVFDRK